VNLGDGDHQGIVRIDVAAGDGLETGDDVGGHDDGIDALVRHGAVRAVAGHGDLEHVVGRHHRAVAHRELAHRQARPIVQPVDLVHGEALEQPLLHHDAPACLALLGRLENEIGGAGKVAGFGQVSGGAQQHRGVPVMAAGMHLAGRLRGIGPVGLLVDVKRIHVGAQADGAAAIPLALEHADDPGAGQPAHHLQPEALQLVGHELRRPVFLVGGLRVRVEIAPPCGHFAPERRDFLIDAHCNGSPLQC
jgi:hypothetical protein